MKFTQSSLRDVLSTNESIVYTTSTINSNKLARLPLRPLLTSLRGNQNFLEVGLIRPYAGYLQGRSTIFQKKYMLNNDQFIAEGLSYGDYTIVLDNSDPNAWVKGKAIVNSRCDINIKYDQSQVDHDETLGHWIGGDSINAINYSHWMFEHLLKFEIYIQCGFDMTKPFFVSSRIPKSFFKWSDYLIGENLNYCSN